MRSGDSLGCVPDNEDRTMLLLIELLIVTLQELRIRMLLLAVPQDRAPISVVFRVL